MVEYSKGLNITSEMLSIIAEIDEFKGAWKILPELYPEKLSALKKVATIESIASSNRIEGNKLSDKNVEEILSNLDKTSFASRDEEEVAGYAKLMNTIFDDFEVIKFSENYIKQLHQILLQFSKKDAKHRGEYKKLPNHVSAFNEDGKEIGIVFETATPFDTPQKMSDLINWTKNNIDDKFIHPLIVIGIFVVNFLAIHPFQDGNGRLSRALTCLLLLKFGYVYTPYSSMESIIEDNKNGYYRALRETQTTLNNVVNYEPWMIFFLRTMLKQKIRLEYKMNLTVTEVESKLYLPELSAKIVELAEAKDRITISYIEESTKANINTIKKHLSELVKQNYLIKHGKTRGAWYMKKEVL
jgi:Fic family protein